MFVISNKFRTFDIGNKAQRGQSSEACFLKDCKKRIPRDAGTFRGIWRR